MRHIYSLYIKKIFLALLLGFVLLHLFTFLSPLNSVKAAINNTINFQSKIVDKVTGLNITNGTPACVKSGADTCDFQIRIWNHATNTSTTSGSGNLMFTQTFQDVEIGDTNGTFNLVINSCGSTVSGTSQWGTTTGTCTVVDDSDSDSDPGVNFDRADLYIEVGFAPSDTSGSLGSFSELFTRIGLKSVPSAFVAQTLSGIGATGFVQLAPSATQTTTSTNSLINLESTATSATNPLILVNENGSGSPDLINIQVGGVNKFTLKNSGSIAVGDTAASDTIGFRTERTYNGGTGYQALVGKITQTGNMIGVTGGVLSNLQINPGAGSTVNQARAIDGYIQFQSAGTITTAYGARFAIQQLSTATVTTAYGVHVSSINSGGGTIGDNYGVFVANTTGGTNDYGLYVEGADTYAIWSDAGTNRFDGNVLAGTTTNTAFLNVAAATTSQSSLRLVSSGGTNPSSPNSGDLWWNGTNLNFRSASSTVDLLAGSCSACVSFAPAAAQTTTSTNSLINLISTATSATNPLLLVNENGTGTPNLFEFQVAGSSRGVLTNAGQLQLSVTGSNGGLLLGGDATLYRSGATTLTTNSSLTLVDDKWIGLGSAAGRIEFDDQSTDEVNFVNANVGIGTSTPSAKLDVVGNIENIISSTGIASVAGSVVVGTSTAWGVDVQGKYAFVTSLTDKTLSIVDTSNPASPSVITTYTLTGYPRGLDVKGSYAYIASESPMSIEIENIADVNSPSAAGTISLGAGEKPIAVKAEGKYLYATTVSTNGLIIYDISNPSVPKLVNKISLPVSPSNFDVAGKYVYIALDDVSSTDYIYIYDISDPYSPVNVNSMSLGSGYNPQDIKVSGKYAYVTSTSANGFVIYNVANPTSISSVGSIAITGREIKLGGRYAFMTNASNTMQIIDISDPLNPSNYQLGGLSSSTLGITAQGRYAYVANGLNLSIIDLTGTESTSIVTSTLDAGIVDIKGPITSQGGIDLLGGLNVGNNGILSSGGITTTQDLSVLGLTLNGQATNSVGAATLGFTVTKNNSNTRVFNGVRIAPTLNTGVSNTNTTVNVLSLDTVNTSVTGLTTNLINASYGGGNKFIVDSSGNVTAVGNLISGNATNTAFINAAAATTGQASLRLISSAGTNPSSPNSGDLWWNGTNLNFRNASTTIDLLAGSCSTCVNFASGSTQSTSSTNSLIDLTTTGSVSTALIKVNENGASAPTLLDLQVAGTTRMAVTNAGQLQLPNASLGILLGGDTQLYRMGADMLGLGTNDSLIITEGQLSVGSTTALSNRNAIYVGNFNTGSSTSSVGVNIANNAVPGTGNTAASVYGLRSSVGLDDFGSGYGTITNAYSGYFVTSAGGGAITNNYALYANASGASSATVTNSYGLYIANNSGAVGTTGTYGLYVANTTGVAGYYGVYSEGGWNKFTGRTAFGPSDPSSGAIVSVSTSSVSDGSGIRIGTSFTGSGYKRALSIEAGYGGNTLGLYAADLSAQVGPGTGNTMGLASGVNAYVGLTTAGTLTNAYAGQFRVSSGVGTITTAYGIQVQSNSTSGGGTIGTNYGIYVNSQTSGTNDYGLYIAGADTYTLWSASGANRFDGNILAGTTTNTSYLNVAPSTTAQASLRLVSSAGTDPSSPNSGDLWWNGTNLNFRSTSSTIDLLAGGGSCATCVSFAPAAAQTTSSTNSLINLETTATGGATLFNLNENGSSTPDFLTLKQAGTNKIRITNSGQLYLTPDTNTNGVINILSQFNTTGGANTGMTFTTQQLAATSGSIDSFTLTPTASVSGGGNVAGMNGILVLPSTSASGTTISTARGFTSWPQIAAGTTITSYYAVSILNPSGSSGGITNNFGVRVDNQTMGTNNYGVYVEGASTYAIWSDSGLNRFDGDVQLGGVLTGIPGTNNTKIQASGTGTGSTGSGSIYFLGSDGSTKGRVDTVDTDLLRTVGDGSDGSITVSTSINWDSAIIATGRTSYADGIAYRVNPPGQGDVSVTRYRSADTISNGIVAGDEIMVVNLQGNLIGTGTTAVFDNASVGNYEFKTVASVSASTITFTEPLEHRYLGLNQNQQRVVIQRVPNYTNVTVNSGGAITTNAYDGLATTPSGSAGYRTGVIAFRANGTVTVNSGGNINTDAKGYRGGAAGAAGANGGFNGESYDYTGTNTGGRGGSGSGNGETWGGGRSSNGATANPANGISRGGGGGGGSNGSASTGEDGSGAGGGGGYGGGGGGGGGGGNGSASNNGGTGGTGGQTEVAAGGGAGAQNSSAVGANGGAAGSVGSNATGTGGSAGDGKISGSGGGGANTTTGSGAGGGGGGLYGFPDLTAIFLGSGGGGGAGGFSTNTAGLAGGNGGGIIFIGSNSITLPGSGTITATGGDGTNGTAPASGGGGGSGGSIYIDANTVAIGTSLLRTHGGIAGTQAARRGASGAGGVGRIYIQYRNSLSGTASPSATVAQVTQNYGTLHIGSVNTTEADLAEYYVTGDREIEAGDVVSISPYRLVGDNEEEITSQGVLRKTATAYDSKLVGVISTTPGVTLGSIDGQSGNPDQRALALSGRVPVKIDPDSEPISIGDYLTSSTKAGYAKKATQPGYVLGKALEYWNKDLNKQKIMTFVGLGYYNGGNSSSEEALRLANARGLSVSNAYNPAVNIKIVQNATDGQVLGTSTESSTTPEAGQLQNDVSVEALEKSMSLALGRSEMSDYFLNGDSTISVGDVVKFDLNNNLIKAGGVEYRGDSEILGVSSTQPNTLLSAIIEADNSSSVTLGGKIVLKVTDLNGHIKKGDYLAASDIPGYAMKADNSNGIVLGRALEDFPLSISPDSSLVKTELSRNRSEMFNLLNNLINEGAIKLEDKQKYEDTINRLTSNFETSTIEGRNAGRILAFVNVGFITEGVMLPKNANLANNSLPGTTEEVNEDLSNLLSKIQNTNLTLNNVLTVKNVIEAQTYQNITGLDLAFKISSQNNSFRVIDINNESIFQVDQNGKISIKSGANSSIGKAVLPPGTIELFVENTSITENSQIYLTPDQFVFSRVKAKNPGQGFWIELQNGFTDNTVNVDYLIIN